MFILFSSEGMKLKVALIDSFEHLSRPLEEKLRLPSYDTFLLYSGFM
jgi:hypothetical protein